MVVPAELGIVQAEVEREQRSRAFKRSVQVLAGPIRAAIHFAGPGSQPGYQILRTVSARVGADRERSRTGLHQSPLSV
jgi:hypothetical protein